MVQASKAEALLAVEFYNTTGERRSLEAFVVHMHIAWLYLLHAEYMRDSVDFRYWETRLNGRRCLTRVDGEPKTWELTRCVRERWANDTDPVRANLEFFIGLRNRIEHRHQDAIGLVVAGHAQAMILNYENELVGSFGDEESLADRLRFPVFISSITPNGVDAIKRIRAKLPARALRYINDFHGGLHAGVTEDARFEFRVHLVPQLGPKTDADLAVNFVQLKDLDPGARDALERLGKSGLIAKQVKLAPVQNLGMYKPQAVVDRVAIKVPGFSMADHVEAWKRHAVRPPSDADDPAATDARYAVWDEPHRDYLYTDAWVRKLTREAQGGYGASARKPAEDAGRGNEPAESREEDPLS
jgi:hypothetical protein